MYSYLPSSQFKAEFLSVTVRTQLELAMANCTVAAGFPSPALDFDCKAIDLNEALIGNATATFLWRLAGTSMRDFGMLDGDWLLVDRSLRPQHQDIVVAELNGEFTCKQLYRRGQVVKLVPGNPEFPEIQMHEGEQLCIVGVVTSCIKRLRSVSR